MDDTLLSELKLFVGELEKKEAAVRYTVPEEVMNAVKRAKTLEKFLHDIFTQVSGNGGIHLITIIRREFGIKAELTDRFEQWVPYSKDQFEDELHEAIDRAGIRAGNQGVFFAGTPSKQEAAQALQLVKEIAHAAVSCQFHPDPPRVELFVVILDKLLQFYSLPNTYPEGNETNYRSLISADRLYAMSGGDERVTDALKAFAKEWYQQLSHTFLESREGYFSYEYVSNFLYALTEEQLERLRGDYIRQIEEEFKGIKVKPDLHRAKKLLTMLEIVRGWSIH